MDYDSTDIPAGYDRARALDPEVLDLWMDAVESQFGARPVSGIVDLGCGTGRFSHVLAQRFGTDVIAIDPSSKMPTSRFSHRVRRFSNKILPDRATLRRVFESAGLQLAAAELLTQTIAPDWATYAEKLAAGGDSALARLSREDLEEGVAGVRRYAEAHREAVVEPIDLLVFR